MKVANNTGVSLVSSCMSRNENLYNSLRSWIPHNSINEIVIVDWNSNEPIYDFISENFNMEKIKIIKVNNATGFTKKIQSVKTFVTPGFSFTMDSK